MRMAGLRDRTKQFALRVIQLSVALPKTSEAQVIGMIRMEELMKESDELIRIIVKAICSTKAARD